MDKRLQLVKNWLYKATHDMEMAKLAMEYKPELRDLIYRDSIRIKYFNKIQRRYSV